MRRLTDQTELAAEPVSLIMLFVAVTKSERTHL